MTNPIPVDETRSLAYREDGRVHVRVHLDDPTVAPGEVTARLRNGERRYRIPAKVTKSEDGGTLELSIAARRLGRVPWFIAIRTEDGRFVRVHARVLAHPDRPVALLPGPPPRTRMPAPVPRTSAASARIRHVLRRGRRLVGAVRRRLPRGAAR